MTPICSHKYNKMITICEENKRVSKLVHEFIANVPDVGEESITDYLIWKWREIDSRFNYLNIKKFTKEDENKKSGADFELELWLVGSRHSFPLVIQAKKFLPSYNSYCSKLNYMADKKRQVDLLIEYSDKKKRLPFYLIYSIPDKATEVMCKKNGINPYDDQISLYLADAYDLKEISDKCKHKKISRNSILKHSNPFCCLFCCPLSAKDLSKYFARYYPEIGRSCGKNGFIYNSNNIPMYVRSLLNNEVPKYHENGAKAFVRKYGLDKIRNVGVLDMKGVG